MDPGTEFQICFVQKDLLLSKVSTKIPRTTLTPHQVGFCKMGMALSPDGRCKTFDESANGFTRADGAGALVLELQSDAQKAARKPVERRVGLGWL